MKLTAAYLVSDPESESTGIRDMCWKQDISKLHLQIFGGTRDWWTKSHVTIHTSKDSALADAKSRVTKKFGKRFADQMFSAAAVRRADL